MKIILTAALASVLAIGGCGSTQETAQTPESESTPAVPAPPVTSSVSEEAEPQPATTTTGTNGDNKMAQKCRLIITFISIGEGTDPEGLTIVRSVIGKYEVQSGKIFALETIPWGREGEVDYCYMLSELSPQDQAALTRELREALQEHPLVQIGENQASMHKR